MDLGRQRTHTGIRVLPTEGLVEEKVFLHWTTGYEQDRHGSDEDTPILGRIIPWENEPTVS